MQQFSIVLSVITRIGNVTTPRLCSIKHNSFLASPTVVSWIARNLCCRRLQNVERVLVQMFVCVKELKSGDMDKDIVCVCEREGEREGERGKERVFVSLCLFVQD